MSSPAAVLDRSLGNWRNACKGIRWALTVGVLAVISQAAEPLPVLLDTDIGSDIDDAYALVQVLRSPELKLLGVTTVSGDAVARARLAAKLLAVANHPEIPVYAGASGAPQYMAQVEWAAGFTSPAVHEAGAVAFLRDQIKARPGEITLIAIGDLTNIAALLASEPGIGAKIKAIALMGGSVRRGSAPGSRPEPEWTIKSATVAAQMVFTSGVPLLVAPLDATADLRLPPEARVKIFAHGVPLNDALSSLNSIWRHTNTWKGVDPTLFDCLPVALVATPELVPVTPLYLQVELNGRTREVEGRKPNTRVALGSDPVAVVDYVTARLTK